MREGTALADWRQELWTQTHGSQQGCNFITTVRSRSYQLVCTPCLVTNEVNCPRGGAFFMVWATGHPACRLLFRVDGCHWTETMKVAPGSLLYSRKLPDDMSLIMGRRHFQPTFPDSGGWHQLDAGLHAHHLCYLCLLLSDLTHPAIVVATATATASN